MQANSSRHASMRAPSNKMNIDRADGHRYSLPGFNSVTPIFLLIDHFLYVFVTVTEENKKNYPFKV